MARLTKYNPETNQYEFNGKAKTQAEFNEQRKAVIQKLGEYENTNEVDKLRVMIHLLEQDIADRDKMLESKVEEVYAEFMRDYKCMREELEDKATEVAEEIFGEIERTARAALILLKFERDEDIRTIKTECYDDLLGYLAELKKKYTEEGK